MRGMRAVGLVALLELKERGRSKAYLFSTRFVFSSVTPDSIQAP